MDDFLRGLKPSSKRFDVSGVLTLDEFAEKIQGPMFSRPYHRNPDRFQMDATGRRCSRLFRLWTLLFLAPSLFFTILEADGLAERPFPKPRGLVNDFAEVIPDQDATKIQALVSELLEKTDVPVVLVTMPDIDGAEYNDYANRLYRAWGIGKKGEDKGVLIFFTLKERKMRIETGYGVESILPDGLVGEIRDRYMIPYFKKDRFGEGMLNGTLAIAQVIAKDAQVQLTGGQVPKSASKGKSGVSIFPIIMFILFFVLVSRRRGFRSLLLATLLMSGRGGRGIGQSSGGFGGSFGGFGGGFGGFGGGMSGGGGAGGSF